MSLEADKQSLLRAQVGADFEELNDRVNALENVPDKWPVAMDDALKEIEERINSVQKYVNDRLAKIETGCEQCYLESQGEGP